VTHRPVLASLLLSAVVGLTPLGAQVAQPVGQGIVDGEPFAPRVEAAIEVGGERLPLMVTLMPAGPLFSLDQIVELLGGELSVGPLAQSHELEVGDTSFRFGPTTSVLTVGQDIFELSQTPVGTIVFDEEGEEQPGTLMVPLDLLEMTWTEVTNQHFSWVRGERLLLVGEARLRNLPLTVDVVHLQGVSTVVLQFPARPRYRVEQEPGRIAVRVLGDRIEAPSSVARTNEGLLAGMSFSSQEIAIGMKPGAGSESYELSNPYRLVFDIFPGGESTAASRPLAPPRRTRIPTIVIDPGHGGGDDGAHGDGLLEKNLTLRLARLLQNKLQTALPVRVVLTRDEDADLPLDTRSALANQLKAELFVSLHLNSSFGTSAAGAETYFLSLEASDERAQLAAEEANRGSSSGDPLSDLQLILWDMGQSRHLAESQRLANLIQEELNAALGMRNRGVKQAPFSVLMGAAMPAVLVELGFMSNAAEVERLQDPLYQNQLAEALTKALVRYRSAQFQARIGGGPEVTQ